MYIRGQNRKKIVIAAITVFVLLILYSKKKILNHNCSESIIIEKSFDKISSEILNQNTIYFLETHNSTEHDKLSAREACSIESAAYMNPNSNVVVLFLTPSKHVKIKNWPEFEPLFEYDNIHFRYFHVDDIIKNTPIEKWMEKGHLSNSYYPVVHTSDVLRYTLLYKYSGIYLDLDVIVTESLDVINSSSFVCYQEDEKINNAIIRLSYDDRHEIGRFLLEEVIETFNGNNWEHNGPLLITKALKKYCNMNELSNIYKCKQLDIFQQKRCYAIEWREWHKLFKDYYANEVMETVKESYFVHLWNAKSKGMKVRTTSHSAYSQLAAKYCPRVHQVNPII